MDFNGTLDSTHLLTPILIWASCKEPAQKTSTMHINEELNREIKELKRSDAEELGLIHHKPNDRIKELNCLYNISSFRDDTDFSLDAVLQAVVDFIPPAI